MRIIVDRGKNAGAILGYLHRPDKREVGKEHDDPAFHTNLFGRTALERTEELRFSADQNPQVEKTYVHYKVSFPPGENPDMETKKGIVDDLLAAREHGRNCQFVAIEHFEKIAKHDVHHLHVLASTVRLDGSWVDDSFERVKLKDVERAIEAKYGLIDCAPKERGDRVKSSIREVKVRESGQTLVKDVLREAIQEAVQDQPSLPLLMVRLKAQGFTMQVHEFDDGQGVSFGSDGRYFQGRQLGDRFSFSGLQNFAGVGYVAERDDAMIRVIEQMNQESCQMVLEMGQQTGGDRGQQEREGAIGQAQAHRAIGQVLAQMQQERSEQEKVQAETRSRQNSSGIER